jgi:hypothetical protein
MSQATTPPDDLAKAPDIVALTPTLSRLREATKIAIKSESQYVQLADELKVVKAAIKTIKDNELRITRPQLQAINEVRAQAKRAMAPFEEQEKLIKQLLVEYANEQERKQREQQRLENERAEKERKRLLEAAQRNADKGNEAQAESFVERARAVSAPVISREPPKVAGLKMPKVWRHRVLNAAIVPREYLMIDETKLQKIATALKESAVVAGVEFYEETIVASTSAAAPA